MFTFGRDHEIKCALHHASNPTEARLLVRIVNAIHDYKEGQLPVEGVVDSLRDGLINGASGTWESAGSWLLKLNRAEPSSTALWLELVASTVAQVRFRVACHLLDMPEDLARQIHVRLSQDRSRRVRDQVEENWNLIQNPDKYS